MARSTARKLKIYPTPSVGAPRPQIEAVGCLPDVLRAFQRATGWSLRYVAVAESSPASELSWSAPVNPGVGASPGHLRLDPLDSAAASKQERRQKGEGAKQKPASEREGCNPPPPGTPRPAPVDFASARAMASSLSGMLNELMETRYALWQREAELAAGVPLVPHGEEEEHLAARLDAVLRGGAEAVGCQAAALYLLDEATTELKLRSCWGLPFDRLTAPARRLQGAMADLEALLGHAVVLHDPALMRHWSVPEDFPAAVCVPVSTPTTLLGTLWIYSVEKRDFNDRETNMLEIVAGRLAADLEREMLLRESIDAALWKRQLAAAERLQRSQLPTIPPLLDGWQVSGWALQSQAVGGDFYDWFCLPNGLLALAAADVAGRGIEAAMTASALKAAVRAHAQYHREAQQALKQINLTLWTGSAGDQRAALFYGLLETATGRLCCAMAGDAAVLLIRPGGWQSLTHSFPQLGESPETDYEQFGYELRRGEVLAVVSHGVRDALDQRGHSLGEAGVAQVIGEQLHLSTDELCAMLRDRLDTHAAPSDRHDRTVLLIKRTTA